ncbi:MAG: RDD family protein [Phycisphaerales bacterium]|nr:RDD family protein [Phycisphaerales bacterium]
MRILFGVIAFLALLLPARGQVLPAAGTVVPRGGETHAWFVGPDDGDPPVAVFHIPPRSRSGPLASGEGVLAIAGRLKSSPEMIAASGTRVILVFPTSSAAPGVRERRVLSITASRSGLGDGWVYDSQGRLDALPALPGAGRLAGLAGTERGAAALILDGETARFLLLTRDGWQEPSLPSEWSPPEGSAAPLLVTLPGAVGLLDLGPSPALWTGTVLGDESSPTMEWERRALPIGAGAGPRPGGPVVWTAGRLTYPVRERGGITLWQLDGGRALRLSRVDGVGEPYALTGIDQAGRIAVIWPQEGGERKGEPGEPRRASIRYRVVEVSASTGRVLYDGGPVGKGPVSVEELRVLAIGLLMVMVLILVLVLRPDSGRPPLALPQGLALAEGSRRWTATLIDVLVAAIAGSKIAGVPLATLLESGLLIEPTGEGGLLLLWMLGVAVAHGALAEWLFGRTLGKWLTACRVVRARVVRGADGTLTARAERPALWRCVLRNVVKWGLPPVAAAGLNAGDRRHRGDVLSGTAVVIDVERPAESPR